ncbi:hypothetical protein ACLOJK_021072 [Asimina triloba]
MGRLAPLAEEPINEEEDTNKKKKRSKKEVSSWRNWVKSQLPLLFHKKSHLKILLAVLACPLSPLSPSPLSKQPCNVSGVTLSSLDPQVASWSEYIIEQYAAATGCKKMNGWAKSIYAVGTVRMVMVEELGAPAGEPEKGCFVMWQMMTPDMWLIELVVAGQKIVAGSDGKVAWRHTPWLGAHAAKGGARPLRRALQGLDPVTVTHLFAPAQYVGEKQIDGEDCFVLKVAADHMVLADRGDSTAEIIRHVMVGHFSQRSGLLVHLEDSHLTRIQSPGAHPIYWETTIESAIKDYRSVDGMMIAHSGQSKVHLARFGDHLKVNGLMTRMEEMWTIDDVVFNVPGLSADCFIPPEEVRDECTKDVILS